MSVRIYEVELEGFAPGQRFCQHVYARSPKQAGDKASKQHGRKVIEVRPRRKVTDEEAARAKLEGKL